MAGKHPKSSRPHVGTGTGSGETSPNEGGSCGRIGHKASQLRASSCQCHALLPPAPMEQNPPLFLKPFHGGTCTETVGKLILSQGRSSQPARSLLFTIQTWKCAPSANRCLRLFPRETQKHDFAPKIPHVEQLSTFAFYLGTWPSKTSQMSGAVI